MKFYESIHPYYDDLFPLNQKQVDWVNANSNKAPLTILDIGCATGNLAIELAKTGHQVNAFDLDGGMIQRATAKSTGGNPQFRRANMLHIEKNYRREFFDAAICFGNTLVHLTSEALIEQFLRAVYAVLKPGALFLIQILNYDYILQNQIKELPLIENNKIKFTRRYYFSSGELIQFKTLLEVKESGKLIENTVELFPLRKNQIAQLLLKAGFYQFEFRSSFNDEDYSPNSLPLIVKAKK